ncbi:MAG: DUF502 domain-containing protein [Chromatiales bacterium]|nr:DUF502 domain-containing protein [Gammaproteobacteria bacterium]MBW6475573.1 DUF502 domain-containing protein [Chromatiales bacterium]
MEHRKGFEAHLKRYLITGMLISIPLWITWLVFGFVFNQLSKLGRPLILGLARAVEDFSPVAAQWLFNTWSQSLLAVLLTLIVLYLLGWITTRVIGKRLLALFESIVDRIPLVQTVYGASKKLVAALQQKPDSIQRVVLIEFPTPEMRAVGFVTKVFTDADTGKKLAAVYVPTTPNPTSGYLEIVPLERVIPTDWSADQAMTFIISGGTVSPENIRFNRPEGEGKEG